MSVSELQAFQKKIEEMDLERPETVLVSGEDPSIFEPILERLRIYLGKAVGAVEVTVLTGEQGDDQKLQEELFNIPLFSPYRLIIIRQAEEVFKSFVTDKKWGEFWTKWMANIPGRTLLFLQFNGTPSAKIEKLFGGRLLHYKGRELYANQVMDVIRQTSKKLGLQLEEDAVYELKEKVQPRPVSIDQALHRLKDTLPESKRKHVTAVDIHEFLFPSPGCNVFELVDALFEKHSEAFYRELSRFDPATDNFFVIFKLILSRTNEIRKAALAKEMGMTEIEMIEFLGLKNRPPFIKKKIAMRLSREVQEYTEPRLSRIYNFLIQMQMEFRSAVPLSNQPLIFSARSREIFF